MTWIDLGDVAGVPTGAGIRSTPGLYPPASRELPPRALDRPAHHARATARRPGEAPSKPRTGASAARFAVAVPHQLARAASPCPCNGFSQGMNDALVQATGGPAEAGGITS